MSLVCGKCNMKDSDYGFEFYRATKCELALCVFCKQIEKKCPTCQEDLKHHGLKTEFALLYETKLIEERRNLSQQIEARLFIEQKWAKVKSETNQNDYHNLLELLEESIQAKYYDDQILLSSLSKKIEDLAERNLFYRNQEMENEVVLDRALPKQLPSTLLPQDQNKSSCGFIEKFYNLRKFNRYF